MGKIARKRPVALVSHSGLWLIGGGLLLSVAVLAWALQSDTPKGRQGVQAFRRSGVQGNRPERLNARTPERLNAAQELAARLPSVAEYGPLLQGNVFQPRVVPPQSLSAAKASPSGHPGSGGRHPGADGAPGGPVTVDGWHDWKYNGIAQLDQQTYALMDQPDKKQSQFVKVGDHLEDATVVGVAENEVTLREADGSVVRVKQVDTVAEQLRAARAATTPPASAAPGAAGSAPTTPFAGPGPVTNFPSPQGVLQGPSAAPAGGNGSSGRRGRRSQQQDGAGDAGIQ